MKRNLIYKRLCKCSGDTILTTIYQNNETHQQPLPTNWPTNQWILIHKNHVPVHNEEKCFRAQHNARRRCYRFGVAFTGNYRADCPLLALAVRFDESVFLQRLLLYACDTPFVWRQRLLLDFADSDGIDGLDLAKKQEIELTLSSSRKNNAKSALQQQTNEEDEYCWKQKYLKASRTRAFVSPCWSPGLVTNIEARQCHAAARCGDFLVVFAGFTRDFDLYALDTRAQLLQANPRQAVPWVRCKIRGQGPQVCFFFISFLCLF
jgi:hypothetical protein